MSSRSAFEDDALCVATTKRSSSVSRMPAPRPVTRSGSSAESGSPSPDMHLFWWCYQCETWHYTAYDLGDDAAAGPQGAGEPLT